jgi:hypothetical protein
MSNGTALPRSPAPAAESRAGNVREKTYGLGLAGLLEASKLLAFNNGVWRSPVARLLWEQEVPGSNPGAPMSEAPVCQCRRALLLAGRRLQH